MKTRKKLSSAEAAAILVASDGTCCVCQDERRKVVIHHLDENPANNSPGNLAVLCSYCHSEIHTSGGHFRKLDSQQVKLYRAIWLKTVKKRRREKSRDPLAPERFLVEYTVSDKDHEDPHLRPTLEHLGTYIAHLPAKLKQATREAQSLFDTGATFMMAQGISHEIQLLMDALAFLLYQVRPFHFPKGETEAEKYVTRQYAQWSKWHDILIHPDGGAAAGSMARIDLMDLGARELGRRIADLVTSHDYFDYVVNKRAWLVAWREVSRSTERP